MIILNSDVSIAAILLAVGVNLLDKSLTYQINHLDNDQTDNHPYSIIKITERGILQCG